METIVLMLIAQSPVRYSVSDEMSGLLFDMFANMFANIAKT